MGRVDLHRLHLGGGTVHAHHHVHPSADPGQAYDGLYRLVEADYSSGENFQYRYDAVGNRTAYTATITSTTVTTYSYDAANRLTKRVVDGSEVYTYTWSAANRLTRETWNGYTVRTFQYDAAGRLTTATLPGFTTTFQYDGDGHRLVKAVNGEPLTYTLDYARSAHILIERSPTPTRYYLYGERCIGEQDGATQEWSFYLADGTGRVRQVTDAAGQVDFAWSYSAPGEVLSGAKGYYVLLDCPEGMYDWSTGLIFLGGRYFDPSLGIWIALGPLIVLQAKPGSRKKSRGWQVGWLLWVSVVAAATLMTGCGVDLPPTCEPIAKYNRDPRQPDPLYDGDILAASVVIEPFLDRKTDSLSLGTILKLRYSELLPLQKTP